MIIKNTVFSYWTLILTIFFCLLTFLSANAQNINEHEEQRLDQLYAEAVRIFTDDQDKGIQMLKNVANLGHIIAQNNLGGIYHTERFGILDYKESIKWFRMAAEQDDPKAQAFVGEAYVLGRGVDMSIQEAIIWYKRAADQNNRNASFELGRIYSTGKYLEPNFKEAAKWYQKAAELKYKPDYTLKLEDNSFFILARHYFNVKSYQDAAYLFSIIAGSEVYAKNLKLEAVMPYLEEAGQQGNSAAYWAIGHAYNNGYGINKNSETAIKYLKKAAANGHLKAQNELSYLYREENMYKESFRYSLLAAEQGYIFAQNQIADHYFKGEGIPKDINKAQYWYTQVLNQNNQNGTLNEIALKRIFKIDNDLYPLNYNGWKLVTEKKGKSYYYSPDSKLTYNHDSHKRAKIILKITLEETSPVNYSDSYNNQIVGLIIDCTSNEYQIKQTQYFLNNTEIDFKTFNDGDKSFIPIKDDTVMRDYKIKACS